MKSRFLITIVVSVLAAKICHGTSTQSQLEGNWESHTGSIFKFNENNLTCIYIPKDVRKKFSRYMNQNRLVDIHVVNGKIHATEILSSPEGKKWMWPVVVTINGDEMIFEYYRVDNGKKKDRTAIFTRYKINDLDPKG